MKVMTINDLYNLCEKQIANGNGDKKIMTRFNNNGDFRGLDSGFTPADVVFGDVYGEYCSYNIPLVIGDRQSIIDFVILG